MSPSPRPGRIRITGMRFWGKHGANPGERETAQPIDVELEVTADMAVPAASDRLDDAIDYTTLFDACERVVTAESFALLEAIAAKILDRVCEMPRVTEAIVRVSKPRLLEGATPQVELVRAKADHPGMPN